MIDFEVIAGVLAGVVTTLAGVLYKQWQKSQRRDDNHIERLQNALLKQSQVLGSVKVTYEKVINQLKDVNNQIVDVNDKVQHRLDLHDKDTKDIIEDTKIILQACINMQHEIESTNIKIDHATIQKT